jgi:ABC-2 type transport system permease protein
MIFGMIKYHLLVLLREPLNVFFGFALPFIMLFAFTGLASDTADIPQLLELNFAAWLTIAAMVLCFTDSALSHAYTRQTKFLRRLRMTPVTPKKYIISGILSRICVLFVMAVALLAVMSILHDKNLSDRNWPLFIAMLLMSFIMFYLIGMFLANLTKGAKRSEGVVYIAFFGMLLIGVWLPVQVLPEAIQPIFNVFPHLSAINLLTSAWIGTDIFNGYNFVAVIAYSVIFGLLSIKFFKFE